MAVSQKGYGDRLSAVQRALADFAAEESFGQASLRCQEHWEARASTQLLKVIFLH